MLTLRQIDDIPDSITKIIAETEQSILNDMARRLSRMNYASVTSTYQMERLQAIGAAHDHIVLELAKALGKTESELIRLFDEAATRTLSTDDAIYRAAGRSPLPLGANPFMQQIIQSAHMQTMGVFSNLTQTTARTATLQFERALDRTTMEITSGAFDYKTAIKNGVRTLTRKGIESITYPSGHKDYLDVAYRRAALTGVNQCAARIQEQRLTEMGCSVVETSAHAGARTSAHEGPENHAWWQGRRFFWKEKGGVNTHGFPDFITSTGYGTGAGLCGWGCRHSWYPVPDPDAPAANTLEHIKTLNNRTVVYNGKEMSLYDATKEQRNIERKIRHWKREKSTFEAAGIDNNLAQQKARRWQATQRDFIDQTGLRRDYFRERAGVQLSAKGGGGILSDITYGRHIVTQDSLNRIPTHVFEQYNGDMLRSQQKDLLRKLVGKPIITEASAYYSMDGRYLAGSFGEDGRAPAHHVTIPHISIHNHPSGLTFSEKDIEQFFQNPNTLLMSVVGNNGASYALERLRNYEAAAFGTYFLGAMGNTAGLSATQYIELMENTLKGAERYGFKYYR